MPGRSLPRPMSSRTPDTCAWTDAPRCPPDAINRPHPISHLRYSACTPATCRLPPHAAVRGQKRRGLHHADAAAIPAPVETFHPQPAHPHADRSAAVHRQTAESFVRTTIRVGLFRAPACRRVRARTTRGRCPASATWPWQTVQKVQPAPCQAWQQKTQAQSRYFFTREILSALYVGSPPPSHRNQCTGAVAAARTGKSSIRSAASGT